MNPRPVYFAAHSKAEIGPQLVARVEDYDQNELVCQVHDKLYQAWQYYFGYANDGFHATSVVSRGGEQGELAEIRVNHSRSLVNALLNLITAPKFVWTPRAASIDYDAVRQTELAAAVLEHYWHNKQMSGRAVQAVESAIVFTEGFIHPTWDKHAGALFSTTPDGKGVLRTGDVKYANIEPWDVFRDPNKKSWDSLDYVTVRTFQNKFDLAARYTEEADAILAVPADNDRTDRHTATRKTEQDDIAVYHFYHKPCAVLPLGREVVFLANGTVLEFNNLAIDEIPLVRIAPSELIGTPFGYTSYLEILGMQELSDSINTSIATNISTFGAQSLAVEEGSPVNVDEIAGGLRVVYYKPGSKPPEALQLTKSPPEAFQYLGQLKSWQELLMGLNAVVRGEAQSDKMSGSALALLQSQAIQQASALQGSYVRALEKLGTITLKLIKKKASAPLKVALVGKHKLTLVRETEIDQHSIDSVDQVYVEMGNPISQTAAGRFELAQLLVQMGVSKSPEGIQQVLDTGRLEPITNASQEELMNILRENQDIQKGLHTVAMLHDQHMLHGKEHAAVVANPAARRDPNVLRAYREHMHEHYSLYYGVPMEMVEMDPLYRDRMLMMTGQQPPPPMMPPGMPMGPPPGPGGEIPAEPGPPPPQVSGPPPGPAAGPEMPRMPTNPATGQEFDPVTGGGVVPPQ